MTKHQRIQFIEQTTGQWPVKKMCQVLQISEAGYYKYLRQKAKPQKTESLLATIYQIIQEEPENANYGVQRIYLSLKNIMVIQEASEQSIVFVKNITY